MPSAARWTHDPGRFRPISRAQGENPRDVGASKEGPAVSARWRTGLLFQERSRCLHQWQSRIAMALTYERAVPAGDRPLEEFTNAGTLGSSESSDFYSIDQGLMAEDGLRILRTHWGLDGPAPFRHVGNVAIGVLVALGHGSLAEL